MLELWVPTANGERLKTYVHNPAAKTALVLCHGFSGCSTGPVEPPLAEYLAGEFLVCRFDFRGQGKSDGQFYDSCITRELEDLHTIITYIRSEYAPKKLIVAGHSFGAAIALLYAAEHPVDGVVSLSGEGDLRDAVPLEFDHEQLEELHRTGATRIVNWSKNGELDLIGRQFLDDLGRYSTAAAVQKIAVPMLFLHGAADEVVPFDASEKLWSLAADTPLIAIAGADHVYNAFTDRPLIDVVAEHMAAWVKGLAGDQQ